MAEVKRTEVFEVPIEKLYQTITDYKSYPDFVDGVTSLSVLEQSEAGARVEYHLNLIKKFKYTLKLTHQKPNQISWVFESGDLFKKNNGSWHLKDLGNGKTEVTYGLEIEIKGFIPGSGAIVNTLTEKNLPAMMKAFHDRARGQ